MTRNLYAVAALAAALTLGTAACATEADTATTSDGNEVSTGLGSADATDDVVLESFTPPSGDIGGLGIVVLAITNRSSKPSDYYIELNVLDRNGVVIGFTNTFALRVPADGGQARVEALVTEDQAAEVVLTEIQRTASN